MTPEKNAGSWDLPNRQVKRITDDEQAHALGMASLQTGEQRGDPTQYWLWRKSFVNVGYYIGLSNIGYATNVFEDGRHDHVELRHLPYSANHIGQLATRAIAQLSSARPDWDVIPKTPDQKDRFGAKVAQQFLDHYYYDLDLRDALNQMNLWSVTTGTAFTYLSWDHNKGESERAYTDPFDEGRPIPSEALDDEQKRFLDEMGNYEDVKEGDIDFDVLSLFQVRVPFGPTRLEDMDWVTITRLRSPDWVVRNYPKMAEQVLAHDTGHWSPNNQWWRRLASMIDSHGGDLFFHGGSLSDSIEVHEHWRPAGGRLKEGCRIVFTENHLLENGPHPFAAAGLKRRFPIAVNRYKPRPGNFWGKSLVEDLIGAQEDLDRGARQLIQHRNILGRPMVLAPKGNGIQSFENNFGSIIEFNPGRGAPEIVNPPTLSQAIVQGRADRMQDLQMLAAQGEATQGQNPDGVRSGIALARLQEQDAQSLAPAVESIERCFREVGEGLLELTAKFVKRPKRVLIYGSSRQMDLQFLSGIDLNGNTTVRLTPGSMTPKSKAATIQKLAELVQMGVLNPMDPRVQRQILEAYEIGGLDSLFARMDGARRRAKLDIEMFVRPTSTVLPNLPMADEDDDHQVFIEEFMEFKTTDDYELMPPIRKQAFNARLKQHMDFVAAQAQAMMMMQGGAGGPGGGSPPKETGEASQPRERQETPGSDAQAGVA